VFVRSRLHESCSVPNFSSSLVSRPIGTTEGQTVYITWRATSRLSIEHPGTQPFTIPGPQPSPKEDALPNSTQVRLQVFSTTAFVMFYFKCVESLNAAFSFHFQYTNGHNSHFFLIGKIPGYAHFHRVQ